LSRPGEESGAIFFTKRSVLPHEEKKGEGPLTTGESAAKGLQEGDGRSGPVVHLGHRAVHFLTTSFIKKRGRG